MNEECKDCKRSETGCLKYISSLSPEDLRDWCLRRKNALLLTNQNIADIANISKRTVDRFFAADVHDFRFSSVQPIMFALLQDFDCRVNSTEIVRDMERADTKIDDLERQLQTLKKEHSFYKKIIVCLGIAVVLLFGVICVALTIDMLHKDRGFFWLE